MAKGFQSLICILQKKKVGVFNIKYFKTYLVFWPNLTVLEEGNCAMTFQYSDIAFLILQLD